VFINTPKELTTEITAAGETSPKKHVNYVILSVSSSMVLDAL